MTDPTTTNIKLLRPLHGTHADEWDETPINGNSDILDALAGSVTSLNLNTPSNDITLNDAQSRVSIIRLSGSQVRSPVITVSAIIKTWIIENNAVASPILGAFFPIFSGGSGNVVAVPRGSSMIRWDGTNMAFVNLQPQIGGYLDWGGQGITMVGWSLQCTVPPFLYCDGSTFNATTYPLLFDIIGTNVLPDFRGRICAYVDGGTDRITFAGSGINGLALGSAGGFQNISLIESQLPIITPNGSVGISDPGHAHSYVTTARTSGNVIVNGIGLSGATGDTTGTSFTGISASFAGNSFGGNGAHNNMPPTVIGGYRFIRAA